MLVSWRGDPALQTFSSSQNRNWSCKKCSVTWGERVHEGKDRPRSFLSSKLEPYLVLEPYADRLDPPGTGAPDSGAGKEVARIRPAHRAWSFPKGPITCGQTAQQLGQGPDSGPSKQILPAPGSPSILQEERAAHSKWMMWLYSGFGVSRPMKSRAILFSPTSTAKKPAGAGLVGRWGVRGRGGRERFAAPELTSPPGASLHAARHHLYSPTSPCFRTGCLTIDRCLERRVEVGHKPLAELAPRPRAVLVVRRVGRGDVVEHVVVAVQVCL